MKKIINLLVLISIAILVTALKNPKHGSVLILDKQDTLKYLNENIIARKTRFIGRPLNDVLNQLNFKVKSYSREMDLVRIHKPVFSITILRQN